METYSLTPGLYLGMVISMQRLLTTRSLGIAWLLICGFSLVADDDWESTHLVWNFGLVTSCDIGPPPYPKLYFRNEPMFEPRKYDNVKSGDIVWIQSQFASEFYDQVLPHIDVPFVMVVSEGDNSFPTDCLTPDQVEKLLANENLIHLFAQNCDYQGHSKKISRIPLGIDFHTVAYKNDLGGWGMVGSAKNQEAILVENLQQAPPTSQRIPRAFIDFQHSDTMHASFKRYLQFGEDRASIFKTLLTSGVVDYGEWMNRKALWRTKREYAFSISPHGNGYDTHRTWEDLALGCIVIVKSSPIDPLYDGLPVIIINDWNEINETNFQRWVIEYGDVSTNPSYREKLTNQYWMDKIKKMAQPYR